MILLVDDSQLFGLPRFGMPGYAHWTFLWADILHCFFDVVLEAYILLFVHFINILDYSWIWRGPSSIGFTEDTLEDCVVLINKLLVFLSAAGLLTENTTLSGSVGRLVLAWSMTPIVKAENLGACLGSIGNSISLNLGYIILTHLHSDMTQFLVNLKFTLHVAVNLI